MPTPSDSSAPHSSTRCTRPGKEFSHGGYGHRYYVPRLLLVLLATSWALVSSAGGAVQGASPSSSQQHGRLRILPSPPSPPRSSVIPACFAVRGRSRGRVDVQAASGANSHMLLQRGRRRPGMIAPSSLQAAQHTLTFWKAASLHRLDTTLQLARNDEEGSSRSTTKEEEGDDEVVVSLGSKEYYAGFVGRGINEEPDERVTGDAILGPTLKFIGGAAVVIGMLLVGFLASNGLL